MDNEQLQNAINRQHHLTAIAPTGYNEFVEKLLNEIGVNGTPMRVPYQFVEYSVAASCYFNVKEKVSRDGGGTVYGWAIWQSEYLCEAEHHAVWHDATGTLIDITPRTKHFDTITFIIDEEMPYKGLTIGNVRVNTSNNTVIDDYILAEGVLDWTRRYEKRIDMLHFTRPALITEYVGDDEKPGPLKHIASNILQYYLLGNTENSICYCNSGKPYKTCHRKINEQNLTIYVNNIIATCGNAPE